MFKITLDRQALEYLWNAGGDNFQQMVHKH